MSQAFPTLAGGLLLIFGTEQSLFAQAGTHALLKVHLRNDATVPENTLESTRQLVGDIFACAGVQVDWTEGTDALTVILAFDASRTMPRLHQDAVGYTPGADGRSRLAYVLVSRVSALALRHGVQRSVVLGIAVAHEVGHMLLKDAHSTTGIMKPDLNRNDFHKGGNRELVFNQVQALKLSQAIRRKSE